MNHKWTLSGYKKLQWTMPFKSNVTNPDAKAPSAAKINLSHSFPGLLSSVSMRFSWLSSYLVWCSMITSRRAVICFRSSLVISTLSSRSLSLAKRSAAFFWRSPQTSSVTYCSFSWQLRRNDVSGFCHHQAIAVPRHRGDPEGPHDKADPCFTGPDGPSNRVYTTQLIMLPEAEKGKLLWCIDPIHPAAAPL